MDFKSYFRKGIILILIIFLVTYYVSAKTRPIPFVYEQVTSEYLLLKLGKSKPRDSTNFLDRTKKSSIKISRPEFFWAISHPFIITKSLRLSKYAQFLTDSISQKNILSGSQGGKLDAFRHGIWMALLSNEIGKRKAIKLGIAHEKANFLNYKKNRPFTSYHHSLMDSINNIIGAEIGLLKIEKKKLIEAVIDSIYKGKFVIIFQDISGKPIDCQGNSANTSERIWNRQECLIYSGFEFIIWEP